MDFSEYTQQCNRTLSAGYKSTASKDTVLNLDKSDADMLHSVVGLAGESGELLDCIKKHLFYGGALDRTNLIEEAGDVLYYFAMLLNATRIDFDTVMRANVEKLKSRYPDGFNLSDSVNRDTAAEKQNIDNSVR